MIRYIGGVWWEDTEDNKDLSDWYIGHRQRHDIIKGDVFEIEKYQKRADGNTCLISKRTGKGFKINLFEHCHLFEDYGRSQLMGLMQLLFR